MYYTSEALRICHDFRKRSFVLFLVTSLVVYTVIANAPSLLLTPALKRCSISMWWWCIVSECAKKIVGGENLQLWCEDSQKYNSFFSSLHAAHSRTDMIDRHNAPQTVMKFHSVHIHIGWYSIWLLTNAPKYAVRYPLHCSDTTMLKKKKKEAGQRDREKERSLHNLSHIPRGTGRVESFLGQQKDNEPLSTGAGCVLGRVGWTSLYKRTSLYGLRVIMT